jgi:hypothetical protein
MMVSGKRSRFLHRSSAKRRRIDDEDAGLLADFATSRLPRRRIE